MKNPKLLLIIPLLLASTLTIIPSAIPRAHALTGVVCLTDTVTVGCPASAETLFAAQGSQLNVLVQISGSDALNGFNVQISTDPTILQAADASLSGSIIGSSANVVLKCLDGSLFVGSACDATDGPGVLHFAATKTGSLVGGSGLLFTATYNVLAKTPGITVNILSQGISNGTPTPNGETTLGANFSNLTDFGIASSPASLGLAAGVTGTTTITLTSFGGFTDFVTLTVTPSSPTITASTVDLGLFLPPDSIATTTLSVSGTTQGNFHVDVTGTGSNPLFTHTVSVPVAIAPPDFTVAASPTSLTLAPGDTRTSTITVGSVSGFVGTVSLTSSVSPSSGLSCSLGSASIVAPGSTSLSCTAAAAGLYTVTVTGTGSSGTHSASVTANVGTPDFSIFAVPDTIAAFRIKPFTSSAASLNLASINNFAGTVTLTESVSFAFVDTPGSSTLPVTVSTSSPVLVAGGTAAVGLDATLNAASVGTGLYVITVVATSGSITHTVAINIWLLDFTVTPLHPNITMINLPGTVAQNPVTIQPIGAPHNATGDIINPYMGGVFGGAVSYPTEYRANQVAFYRSVNGAKFATALGLDTTFTTRRCFVGVFDSGGVEVMPVWNDALRRVDSFAAPVVHYNGDQDGDPPTFNGCRFDAFWFALPSTPDRGFVTAEPITTTPNGTFTASICFQVGSLVDCDPFTIVLVAPPASPALNQFSGRGGTYSLATTGGLVTFKVGVTSQDATTTEFVSASVTAVSSDGTIVIQGSSGVVTLSPLGKVNNIAVTLDFSGVPAGTTFNVNAVVVYGVSPFYLTVNSAATVGTPGKVNGSIVIVP